MENSSIVSDSYEKGGSNINSKSRLDDKRLFSAALPPQFRGVERVISRHGRVCYYYREGRGPRFRIRADLGTPEFIEEYKAVRERRASTPASFVYFARSGKRVKIGISKNPRSRLGSIRTGSSTKVSIYYVTPGGREKEKELHALFAKHRLNGEWFIYAREIQDWISSDEAARWKEAT